MYFCSILPEEEILTQVNHYSSSCDANRRQVQNEGEQLGSYYHELGDLNQHSNSEEDGMQLESKYIIKTKALIFADNLDIE